ncbi:MAG: hypothetical protein HFE81_04895 [Bacilli bacterium]|nr:hypothetical protein [Bacilli bacterium]
MKLKKKAKRAIILILIVVAIIAGLVIYKKSNNKDTIKEAKVVNEIKKYGYQLKDNKPKKYQDMFSELKEILTAKKVDEEAYVKKITEMFIYDFYSLNDKAAKTDVGGIDFVNSEIAENFLQNAENTYYKYVESNIYNNRKQSLPTVSEVKIESVEQEEYAYGEKTDEEAYHVTASWSYTDDNFSDYQKNAELIFVHDGIKLVLVELQ